MFIYDLASADADLIFYPTFGLLQPVEGDSDYPPVDLLHAYTFVTIESQIKSLPLTGSC